MHVSFTLLEGRGRGVARRAGTFKNMCEALFPHLWKKTQGHFSTGKELACQISADSEQLGKSLRNSHIGPACTELFNYNFLF